MLLGNMEPILKSYIIRAIRDAFKRSNLYKQAKESRRVEQPQYKKDGTLSKKKKVMYRCEGCQKLFKSSDVQVDHKLTVVPIGSSTNDMTIQNYIDKVFCNQLNLQLLCSSGKDSCHSKKTSQERTIRNEVKSHKFRKR